MLHILPLPLHRVQRKATRIAKARAAEANMSYLEKEAGLPVNSVFDREVTHAIGWDVPEMLHRLSLLACSRTRFYFTPLCTVS